MFAQFTQFVAPTQLLPPFESWQGSATPYLVLLSIQLLLLALSLFYALRMRLGRISPKRRTGVHLWTFGIPYAGAMFGRLVVGAFHLSNHEWFLKLIPAAFHLVIASYLLVFGYYHLTESDE